MQSLGLIKTFQTDFKQKSYRKRGLQEVKHTQVHGHSLLLEGQLLQTLEKEVSNGLDSTLATESPMKSGTPALHPWNLYLSHVQLTHVKRLPSS